MKSSSLYKKTLSGLAVVTLTLCSTTAFAGKSKGHIYNPNTPS